MKGFKSPMKNGRTGNPKTTLQYHRPTQAITIQGQAAAYCFDGWQLVSKLVDRAALGRHSVCPLVSATREVAMARALETFDVQARPFWGSLITLGVMLYDAYTGSRDADGAGSLAGALVELVAGLDELKGEINDIQNDIREITSNIKKLPTIIAEIASEQSYRDFVTRANIEATTAIQSLRSFLRDENVAAANSRWLFDQLEVVHRSCNMTLANRGEFLEPHFAAAGYFAQWWRMWNTVQDAMVRHDPSYPKISAKNHDFYSEYSAQIKKVVDKAYNFHGQLTEHLALLHLPGDGDLFEATVGKQPWETLSSITYAWHGSLSFETDPNLSASRLRYMAPERPKPSPIPPSPLPIPSPGPALMVWYPAAVLDHKTKQWVPNSDIPGARDQNEAFQKYLLVEGVLDWRKVSLEQLEPLQDIKQVREKVYLSFQLNIPNDDKGLRHSSSVKLVSRDGFHTAEILEDDLGTQVWEDGECIRTGGPGRLDEWRDDYIRQAGVRCPA